MKTYKIDFTFTQYSKATMRIQAESLEAARVRAEEMQADEIDDWNPVDGELHVEDVEECETQQQPQLKG